MEDKEKMLLETMKKVGKSVRPGDLADITGLESKEVSEIIKSLKSKGKVITVYIELPEGYDVSDIDINSVTLNSTVSAFEFPYEIEDYDQDGIPDLMLKFDRQAFIESLDSDHGAAEITVEGQLHTGIRFEGIDIVKFR